MFNDFVTKHQENLKKFELEQLTNGLHSTHKTLNNLGTFLESILSVKIALSFSGKNKQFTLKNQFEDPSKKFFDEINNKLVNYLHEKNIPTGQEPKDLIKTSLDQLYEIIQNYSVNIISLYLQPNSDNWDTNKKQSFKIQNALLKTEKNISIQEYVLNSREKLNKNKGKYIIGVNVYRKTKEEFPNFKDISLKNVGDDEIILKDGIYNTKNLSNTLELTGY